MTPPIAQGLDAIALFLILAFTFSCVAAVIPLRQADAARQERATRYRLFLPPAAALFIVVLGFCSAAFDAWDQLPDHCGATHLHAATLCYMHPLGIAQLFLDEITTLLLSVALVAMMLVKAARLAVGYRHLSRVNGDPALAGTLQERLLAWGTPWAGPVIVLQDARPICFTSGLRVSRLVVTTGLLAGLGEADLRAVIAHEQAHVRRQDGVWRLLGAFAAGVHVPGLGRRALEAWVAASEVVCDEAAALSVGSRLAVAGTLVRFQRLVNAQVAPVRQDLATTMAFAGNGALETRVRWLLLAPPASTTDRLRHWPWLAIVACCWQDDAIHIALEHILRVLHS